MGELRQETDTKQCSLFHGLQFDHPDRALQKNLEQKKLGARMSLRA